MNKHIELTEENLVKTYAPKPIVIESGKGAYLFDDEGKKYLDFQAGYAVSGLGYDNKEYNEALKSQVDKIIHTSNLYYNTTRGEAAKDLRELTGMAGVFFTNSGTESNEGALKAARKYHYLKKTGRYEIIAMENSFHGRSLGALSVTGTTGYRVPFEPLLPTVHFAKFNDIQSVKNLVNDKTCAIILEFLQGEGGINLATKEFVQGIRDICDKNDIILIADEIQCGMGRTGEYFACDYFEIKPDIMTMAKAIGNGVPVGAFAVNEKIMANSLSAGDHGTTYGGNPLCCLAVSKTIELYKKYDILANVKEVGSYLTKKLDKLVEENPLVVQRKGIGFMQGIELAIPVGEIIDKAMENGLLIISAKGNVIRFVPPLIITKEHVDEMIEILKKSL